MTLKYCDFRVHGVFFSDMSTVIAKIEKLAFSLSEKDRAKLAERLLISLRPVLDDEDDGVAEAMRRSRELDENPEMAISHEKFVQSFEEYRR